MKKIFLLLIVSISFISCGENPEYGNPEYEIVVDTPSSDQTISSPLSISGKATGSWFFEGSFPVQLVDLNDEIIASGLVYSKSEWTTPDLVEFEGSLEFFTDQNSGMLIFRNDNPSGLPENEVTHSVPVKFMEIDQKGLVENYIRENISSLNPSEPILGGSWYVLDIEFGSENTVKVYCEDGHIQSTFTANYIVDEDGKAALTDIVEVPAEL